MRSDQPIRPSPKGPSKQQKRAGFIDLRQLVTTERQ
jgi:hypothetical protein